MRLTLLDDDHTIIFKKKGRKFSELDEAWEELRRKMK